MCKGQQSVYFMHVFSLIWKTTIQMGLISVLHKKYDLICPLKIVLSEFSCKHAHRSSTHTLKWLFICGRNGAKNICKISLKEKKDGELY